MQKRSKSIKIIFNFLAGPLVFCLLLVSIYKQLEGQHHGRDALLQLGEVFDSIGWLKLIGVLMLMVLNWGLEALKWRRLMFRLQPVSLGLALKAVFAGTTWAMVTPNRVGDLVGRALFIDEPKRVAASALTLLGSMVQLWVTLLAGIIGMMLLFLLDLPAVFSFHWTLLLFLVAVFSLLLLTLLFLRLERLVHWVVRFPRWQKQLRFIHVLDHLNSSEYLTVYGLSLLRYLVFLAQYFLLFDLFRIHLSLEVFACSVSVVFLVMAIIPSLAMLTELGIRGQTSLSIFRIFTPNLIGILAVTFSIWLINLVLPALIGGFIFLRKTTHKSIVAAEDPNGSCNFDA